MTSPPRPGRRNRIRNAALVFGLLCTAVRADVLPAGRRAPAPAFALEDAGGRRVSLDSWKGKVVLVNFWATWCHGCQTEIPWFDAFSAKYRDRGLAVVGVSMDKDGWTDVRPYLEKKKLHYPIVIGDAALAKAYGLGDLPRTVLVDREGRVAAAYDGVVDRADFERDLQTLLGKDAAPVQ